MGLSLAIIFVLHQLPPETTKKWVIVLQGGGLCVEPIDCYIRRDSDQGSSKTWQEHWVPGTDGMGDIVYDNEELNPYFHDYNHVYLRYCTGGMAI